MKYKITTFGCQMNEHDSEKLSGILEDLGYRESTKDETPDIVILNTCSVRDNADNRFFGHLGVLKNTKEKHPNLLIGVCGCMMQQPHIIEALKKSYPFVDMVFGTHNIQSFPEILKKAQEQKKTYFDVWDEEGAIPENLPIKRKFKEKALVNIMTGCNNFCTYCIVPYTRGREQSRNPEDIVKQVEALGKEGVKEITLLGQNVNSYGKTLETPISFAQLLGLLNPIEGIERIRFMTSHPKDVSDELIEAIGSLDHVCNYIHLPVQSGSSRILKLMNRGYTKEDYLALVEKFRKGLDEFTISTDFIVGFPGETEADFLETLDLVEQVGFDSAFTFIFSPRKGTKAYDMADDETYASKHERFNRLVTLQNQISFEKNKAFVGKKVKVLVEGNSKTDSNKVSGRTDLNKLVNFPGTSDLIGKIVEVTIVEAKSFSLEGKR